MAALFTKIQGLSKMQPLFQEFCKISNLGNGDFYRAIDYIFWADTLTLKEELEITRKYDPTFKIKGCNL